MNKREFIKELERKLRILDENELKDIINEYKDVIDEKVKHGKSEEEAVQDFGDIDELTKEILKAYKINPKYDVEEDEPLFNVKETIEDFESWIKRSAKKMADFSKDVYNDFKKSNLTIELIFEILIKVIILLILFALLRLPFELIIHLGKRILDIAFYPLDKVLMFVWDIIVFLLYFVCCVLISIAMFKNYFNNSNKDNKKTPKKKEIKKEKKVIQEIKEDEKKGEKVEVKTNSNESISSVIGKVLKVIFQVLVVICCIIPLAFLIFGVVIVLILSIYYLCIGINTLGVLLISIGLFILFSYTSDIFNSLAFNHKKIHFYPFLISLIFVAVGFLLTIHMVFNIEYLETIPSNNFNENISEYEFQINKETIIQARNIEYIIDNSIDDNKIKVEVSHYSDLTSIGYYNETYSEEYDYISLYTIDNVKYNSGLKVYNLIIDNLKENKIYNYNLLYNSNAKVYANEMTMNLIKKD